jgi:hypothetical protein
MGEMENISKGQLLNTKPLTRLLDTMMKLKYCISAMVLATVSFASSPDILAGNDTGGQLLLSKDGNTGYSIVKPDSPTLVDDYAAKELAGYLELITGVKFPITTPSDATAGKPSIYIGVSGPVVKHLGSDPMLKLKDQEFVVRNVGQDIFLYGKGVHGNLYAVMDFLENSLGWRWYSVFESPVIPARRTLILEPFERQKGFSFAYRCVSNRRGLDFFYQQRMNMGFDEHVKRQRLKGNTSPDLNRFVSEIPDADLAATHNLFSYITPNPKSEEAGRYDWVTKNYFATNPDFFSLWDNGQRIDSRQLCFSNPKLREELTKNILKHISIIGGRGALSLCAQDNPGPFCYCKSCKELEEKYKSPGGPFYDYLIELCTMLKSKHPDILVKTLAYRRAQTQKPPALAEGVRLPENIIVDFAHIEDNYFADWENPDTRIQDTYRDLLEWRRISSHLWAWLYPHPSGSGTAMPVGNIERNIKNIRMLHKAGVEGVFLDQGAGFNARSNFSDLQSYLLYKLMQDVNCDTEKLIIEVTDNFYGSAAPLARKYMAELEQCRKTMALPPNVTYTSSNTDARTFPYLTAENIHRWETYFDQMESGLKGQPERFLGNVRLLRRELDLAALWKWFDLKKVQPEYYTDYKVFSDRIEAVNNAKEILALAWEKKGINRQQTRGSSPGDFITVIQAGGHSKPLPQELAGIDPSLIRQYLPKYPKRRPGPKSVLDKDAAFGYAVPVAMPDLPFTFGFYQNDIKTVAAKRSLELNEIKPGGYVLYKLGTVKATTDCMLWFSRGWDTNIEFGDKLFEAGGENVWDVYVSLKFDAAGAYGNKPDEALLPVAERKHFAGSPGMKGTELVLVDRIILVNRSADQFKKP